MLEEVAEVEVEAAQGVGEAEVALKLQHRDERVTPDIRIARNRQTRIYRSRSSKESMRAVEVIRATAAIARRTTTTTTTRRRKRFRYRVIVRKKIKPPNKHHQHALQIAYASSLPRRADVEMVINATICTR